ncbi:murein transglycosylase [Escherichia coli]|uniref:Murein transglycosylase n=1 Tax=Escherichia coli TaxID=562 RepID=A0A377AN02_ECOLX|nr:murein transglycosylase [Escherichia coli]
MEKAKQVTWRLLAAGVCLLTVSSVARADSLDEQRSRYAQIKQAWDNRQMDVGRTNDAWTEGLSALSLPGIPPDHR